MIIAKCTRPSTDGFNLVLYCKPSLVGEILSDLTDVQLLETDIEFIKVIE